MTSQDLLAQLRAAIAEGAGEKAVVDIAEQIVAAGIDAKAAIDVAAEAIRTVGDRFEAGDIFLPELMIAGKTMERCLAVLKPHLKVQEGARKTGRVVIGTVSGDIHDIGKNLVATMLSVGGLEVVDVGVNAPPLSFVTTARERGANIIALSALMTTSMPYQREVVELLKEMGLRDKHYVIVGGGPVTVQFAEEIGADGWAENAATAIRLCDQLLAGGQTPPLARPIVV